MDKPTLNPCPFCGADLDRNNPCPHFVGWTSDGREIDVADPDGPHGARVLPSDHLVKTGFSVRVYRRD